MVSGLQRQERSSLSTVQVSTHVVLTARPSATADVGVEGAGGREREKTRGVARTMNRFGGVRSLPHASEPALPGLFFRRGVTPQLNSVEQTYPVGLPSVGTGRVVILLN